MSNTNTNTDHGSPFNGALFTDTNYYTNYNNNTNTNHQPWLVSLLANRNTNGTRTSSVGIFDASS
jgi:hypothetical protein